MFGSSSLHKKPAEGEGPTEFTLNLEIAFDEDDGWDDDTSWTGNDTRMIVGRTDGFGGILDIGVRFRGVNIPAAATIVSADLQVEFFEVATDVKIIVQAHDTNNAGTWNGISPSTMSVTIANVTRTINTIARESFDVKEIVQEVVDGNSGTGDALAFGLLDNGTAHPNNADAETRETTGTLHATLDIVYTTP